VQREWGTRGWDLVHGGTTAIIAYERTTEPYHQRLIIQNTIQKKKRGWDWERGVDLDNETDLRSAEVFIRRQLPKNSYVKRRKTRAISRSRESQQGKKGGGKQNEKKRTLAVVKKIKNREGGVNVGRAIDNTKKMTTIEL